MKAPSALTVMTSVLLILLPALAVVQYRWVGPVSDAELERMQRNMRIAAYQFRESFDDEIVQAVLSLRADAETVREGAWYRYAERYETWLDSAEHPGIAANIYLVDADADVLCVRQWNRSAMSFDAIPWPAVLVAWQPRFEQALAAFKTGSTLARSPLPDDDSVLVAPLVNPAARRTGQVPAAVPGVFGLTVLQLDMQYIRGELLPRLVERHFTNTEGDAYRVAVVDVSDPGSVIYRSDPEAPTDVTRAAEAEPLYSAFRDPLGFQRGGPEAGRGGRDGGRGEGRRNAGRERGGPDAELGSARWESGRWALFVQHGSGSLEAAVAGIRRRNLGISFGVLLLLTGSVGLLGASSRRAHRLARQQMEFVAGVSHELRSPVAVIRSAAENLSHGVVGSDDRVKRYGQVIETESRRLGEMVEHVLQYAGIASGLGLGTRVPLVPSDLIDAAVTASIAVLGPVNVQRTIESDLPAIIGDERALRSAVQNLIANAIKYGGPDRWVGIRAERIVSGRRQHVRITVEDHGPGIPKEELSHIFEPFYRGAEAVSQQVHGSGLGLALVQQIVGAHDGHVAVSTRTGAGSAFTLSLPAADADARATLPRATQTVQS